MVTNILKRISHVNFPHCKSVICLFLYSIEFGHLYVRGFHDSVVHMQNYGAVSIATACITILSYT